MATSAATLTIMLKTLSEAYNIDQGEMTTLLSGKGLLPKKMLVAPKVTKAMTKWASKAAQELAADHNVPECQLKGSGKDDKITVKDVKGFLEAPIKKVNASPAALKFVRDNSLDIHRIAVGSGKEGKIVLKDVQELQEPDPRADSEDEDPMPAMSPSAAKIVKQHDLDAEDLKDIKGTGRDGKILKEDLIDLLKELEDDEQ